MDEDPWANAQSPRTASPALSGLGSPRSATAASPRASGERVSTSSPRRVLGWGEDDDEGDLGRPSTSSRTGGLGSPLAAEVSQLSVEQTETEAKEEVEEKSEEAKEEEDKDEDQKDASAPPSPRAASPAAKADEFDDVPFDDEPAAPSLTLAPPPDFSGDTPDPFAPADDSRDVFASTADDSQDAFATAADDSQDAFASTADDDTGGFDDFDDFDEPAATADFGDDDAFGDFGDFEDADLAEAPAAPVSEPTPAASTSAFQEPRWVSGVGRPSSPQSTLSLRPVPPRLELLERLSVVLEPLVPDASAFTDEPPRAVGGLAQVLTSESRYVSPQPQHNR